jgi:hypothetical protein
LRWNRAGIDGPSSLMSPESPEMLRHPPSPHLKKADKASISLNLISA